MNIIVDTNIVFSAFLNTDSLIGDILLNSQGTFSFLSCEYLRLELDHHKQKILQLKNLPESDYQTLAYLIFEHIEFISESLIPFDIWKEAARLVRNTDMNDIAFVALSLYTDAPIWTGDKSLAEGLRNMGYQKVFSTADMQEIRLS